MNPAEHLQSCLGQTEASQAFDLRFLLGVIQKQHQHCGHLLAKSTYDQTGTPPKEGIGESQGACRHTAFARQQ